MILKRLSIFSGVLFIFGALFSTAYGANAGDRLYNDVPAEFEELNNPFPHTDPVVSREGKKLYRKNCAICHGTRGNGRGPIGRTQNPKPTSFLDLAYLEQHSDQHLYWAVIEGSSGTAMPAFKSALDDDSIWKIISYIRLLPKKYK